MTIRPQYKKMITAYVFLLPCLIIFILFWIYPLFQTVRLSFFQYDMIRPPEFIGLDHWKALFRDKTLANSMIVTLKYILLVVPALVIIPLIVAYLLCLRLKLSNFFKALFYLPTVISMVILCMVWKFALASDGLINSLFRSVGLAQLQQGWLTDPDLAIFTVGFVTIVGSAGFYMMIYLTGLIQISQEIREAANMDGATNFTYFRRIAVPMVRPQIVLVSVISTIGALKVFPEVFLLTGGGPLESTNAIVFYIYKTAFDYFEMGYASAMSVLFLIITLCFSLVYIRIIER